MLGEFGMLASVLAVCSTRSALKDKNKLGPRLVRVFPAGLACLLSLFWCGHFIFGSVKRPCGHMKLGRGELQRGSSRGLGSIWFLRFMSTPQVAPSGRELCFNPPGVEFNVEFMGFVYSFCCFLLFWVALLLLCLIFFQLWCQQLTAQQRDPSTVTKPQQRALSS